MGKILYFIFVLLLFYSCSSLTYVAAEPELMEMQEVIEVPGKTKPEIYILVNDGL